MQGFSGEQFALPEAVDSLRATRHLRHDDVIALAASDPVNLIGIVVPGERTSSVAGRKVWLRGGLPCDSNGDPIDAVATPAGIRRRGIMPSPAPEVAHSPEPPQTGLFA